MTAADDPVARWVTTPARELLWAPLSGGAAAVFHRPSGKTHFLNATSVAMLRRLETTPGSSHELAFALDPASAEPAPEFLASLDEMLRHFAQLGLVHRAGP